jgi:hypothetical protein
MRGNGSTIAWFKIGPGNIFSVLEATMQAALSKARRGQREDARRLSHENFRAVRQAQ